MRMGKGLCLALVVAAGVCASALGQGQRDLSKDRTLYVVGYSHLDTQWRWDYVTTVDEFIRATLEDNFELFEKYPEYTFSFTGSRRYRMMKEYYPELYEQLKEYIAAERWHVSGSSVDEGDVNAPSAESVIRQVLYGNLYFREEFGKESVDYMLPDCFGFPASLPSVWAHCGLEGFSTQKLTWGSAVGIPFRVGMWEGPDGRCIVAALDPGSYVGKIEGRLDKDSKWADRVIENGEKTGVYADYHYYGVGDRGGACREDDVKQLVASLDNEDSEVEVVPAASDQLYKDLSEADRAKLPRFKGDMLLTEHSAGTLTSQAYMKRWNRKNEQLADAAERAAVLATWLGGIEYPGEKLRRSWERVLGSQMHDILPGTSIPSGYDYGWNDEVVALNGFAAVLEDAAGVVASAIDRRVEGEAVVVYNPLAREREDVVQARVVFASVPGAVRVYNPRGREVPSQVVGMDDEGVEVLFLARAPSVGFACYDVRPAGRGCAMDTGLKVVGRTLENGRYRVEIDRNGDIASVYDKDLKAELLAGPARLALLKEDPANWPAWNMDWADRQRPPAGYVDGPAEIRIVENGPVRVGIEVVRQAQDSIFTQRIRLAAGSAGERVECATQVDWQSRRYSLKAAFPLTVGSPQATYNLTMGTVERGNNDPKKYEVPAHEWFDVTDRDGSRGVTVLEDCKFGSDKPSDNEVRLTLLYTPDAMGDGYMDQESQDWGRHEMVYGLYSHAGDWREGGSEWQGRRLNQPLVAFQAPAGAGALGREFSLVRVSTGQVDVRALKKAEESDYVIVRLQELVGRAAEGVKVSFSGPVVEAFEVNGQEQRIGAARVADGELVCDMGAYSPRSFAVRLGEAPVRMAAVECASVGLPFDTDVMSGDGEAGAGAMDGSGRSLPAELVPAELESEGVRFELGSGAAGEMNAVACRGQVVELPAGDYERVYFLAAAGQGDAAVDFAVDGRYSRVRVQEWTGFVGQFDRRVWDREFNEIDYNCYGKVIGLENGFIKRDNIAWFCTHRHDDRGGNEAYQFSYLFKYSLALPKGARAVTLPVAPGVKVLAMTVARNGYDEVKPAWPLYDDFSDREAPALRVGLMSRNARGKTAMGRVVAERAESYEALAMGGPRDDDAANYDGEGSARIEFVDKHGFSRPRADVGQEGTWLTRLNNGKRADNNDDLQNSTWFDGGGELRFVLDLQEVKPVEEVRTYSWHRSNRAPQRFTLWASKAAAAGEADVRRGDGGGWTFVAEVDTSGLGEGGIHVSAVQLPEALSCRYLMWVNERAREGTFFTEVDVAAAK